MLPGMKETWPGLSCFIDGRRLCDHTSFSWTISERLPLFKQLDEELRQNLKTTMQQKYRQPGEERVTQAVDNLQQEVQQAIIGSF